MVALADGSQVFIPARQASERYVSDLQSLVGTTVTFKPDPTIFTDTTTYDYDILLQRLREQAFLNAGLAIELIDLRPKDENETAMKLDSYSDDADIEIEEDDDETDESASVVSNNYNGIIIPEKYSRDWYNDPYHNWQELDNLLGGGTPKDGTLTIQKNGDTVGTFSANQATDETINIEVPTKTSDLTNDSNFVQSSDLSTVATSGSYNDLSNKPTIPTVNN